MPVNQSLNAIVFTCCTDNLIEIMYINDVNTVECSIKTFHLSNNRTSKEHIINNEPFLEMMFPRWKYSHNELTSFNK